MERHTHWCRKYTELQAGRAPGGSCEYSKAQLSVFPRYNVLHAILLDVQRIVPNSMSLEECREMLVLAGQTGDTIFTQSPKEDLCARVMQEERDFFCAFVQGLDEDLLWRVQALPHCRVLGVHETRALTDSLTRVWGVMGSWYPLEPTARGDVDAFLRVAFETADASRMLKSILHAKHTVLVLHLDEEGVASEIDLDLLDVGAAGEEEFWTAPDYSWLLYVSHESTVTIGGWLLEALQAEWKDWRAARWHAW